MYLFSVNIYLCSVANSFYLCFCPAAVDFFNQVNILYGTLTEFCTASNCPTMTAGPKYHSQFSPKFDSSYGLGLILLMHCLTLVTGIQIFMFTILHINQKKCCSIFLFLHVKETTYKRICIFPFLQGGVVHLICLDSHQ